MSTLLLRLLLVPVVLLLAAVPVCGDSPAPEPAPAPRPVSPPSQPALLIDALPPLPPPYPMPHAYPPQHGTRSVWELYAVDRTGRFRPLVIGSPYGDYYLYNRAPYPWATTRPSVYAPKVAN